MKWIKNLEEERKLRLERYNNLSSSDKLYFEEYINNIPRFRPMILLNVLILLLFIFVLLTGLINIGESYGQVGKLLDVLYLLFYLCVIFIPIELLIYTIEIIEWVKKRKLWKEKYNI